MSKNHSQSSVDASSVHADIGDSEVQKLDFEQIALVLVRVEPRHLVDTYVAAQLVVVYTQGLLGWLVHWLPSAVAKGEVMSYYSRQQILPPGHRNLLGIVHPCPVGVDMQSCGETALAQQPLPSGVQ